MNHPLDGNMIAADAHYAEGDDPQHGDVCKICLEGWLEADLAAEGFPLFCDTCGEAAA